MNNLFVIVLTGGPGGGKTTFIEELSRDPSWSGRIAALPEAIYLMSRSGISAREKSYQREMVRLQIVQEDRLLRNLNNENRRIILCNRGSLDPLAYWLDRGWAEEEFFAYTHTSREEAYRRYAAVLHLVTTADGAEKAYRRWPEDQRSETIAEAVRLDRLLQQVWGEHPHYHSIGNESIDWAEKSRRAKRILETFLPDRISPG